MSFGLLSEFSGSSLLPSRRMVEKEDFSSLAEKAYLLIVATRVLAAIPSSADWAQQQIHRTLQSSNFEQWKNNSTDLYVVLWALTQGEYPEEHGVPRHIREQDFLRWLRALAHNAEDVTETKRLFLKLDTLLHIKATPLKSVRRLAQNWPDLSSSDKELCVTHLLEIMRARMPRSDYISRLAKAAHEDFAELTETASSGATSAASVATVVGGLGAGFDPNGDYGIYGKPKTKKSKKTPIIRR